MLLIFPPCAKSCEPPAGIAVLHQALSEQGVSSSLIDANLESLSFLLGRPLKSGSRRTRAALRNRDADVRALKDGSAFHSMDHYSRIVWELNHAVQYSGGGLSRPGLADYRDAALSPVRSGDLLRQAEEPGRCAHDLYYQEEILPRIEAAGPEWIGISIAFLSQALPAFALIGRIRSRFPAVKIAVGGGLVTSWMRLPGWKEPFAGLVDFCVEGPGEAALLSVFGKDNDSAAAPLPDYAPFSGLEYWSPGRVLPVAASTGCWWKKCAFCPENAENLPYRSIPPSKITDYLESADAYVPRSLPQDERPDPNAVSPADRRSHAPCGGLLQSGTGQNKRLIHFLDNALSPTLIQALIKKPPGSPWYGYIRMTGEWTDPEYCLAVRRSGCVMLKLGLESGDPEVLGKMNKGIRLDDAALILRNLKKAGIAAYVYLLFGTPWEDEERAQKTMDFVLRHSEHIGFINAAIFNLPRFSAAAEGLKIKPFYEGDLSFYADFEHPREWKRALVRRFLSRTFSRHPAIRNILKKTPPHFTSNHAPFFLDQGIPG
ncbi:radical SAM protein [bacterium]|nr:radical SAM protein [bacterium]